MHAATQPAQINYHRDQEPQEIDSRRRHATVKFPCVYDRGERQENEAEYRQHQTTMECALEVGREDPQQHERDAWKQHDDEQEEARHSQSQAGTREPAQCDDTKIAPCYRSPPPYRVLGPPLGQGRANGRFRAFRIVSS